MRLNEVVYSDAVPIDGYGAGFFRVGGEVKEGAILTGAKGTSTVGIPIRRLCWRWLETWMFCSSAPGLRLRIFQVSCVRCWKRRDWGLR